ncbi:hypothetical protein [Streptomyces sp. NPDC003077]|uniref:hypothetical protein n=1 Tax=Streptomyces sp. NPDC003077 TaxID=3154443 RepID=UPI0033BA3DC8
MDHKPRKHTELTTRPSRENGSARTVRQARTRTVCTRCGATAEGEAVTWTCSVEGGVRRYFCDRCARENIRSIEGRLDSAWW